MSSPPTPFHRRLSPMIFLLYPVQSMLYLHFFPEKNRIIMLSLTDTGFPMHLTAPYTGLPVTAQSEVWSANVWITVNPNAATCASTPTKITWSCSINWRKTASAAAASFILQTAAPESPTNTTVLFNLRLLPVIRRRIRFAKQPFSYPVYIRYSGCNPHSEYHLPLHPRRYTSLSTAAKLHPEADGFPRTL